VVGRQTNIERCKSILNCDAVGLIGSSSSPSAKSSTVVLVDRHVRAVAEELKTSST